MNTKIFASILLAAAMLPAAASADNSTSTPAVINATSTPALATSTPSVLGVQVPAVPALIAQIQQAKADLNPVKLNYALSPVYKNVKNKKTGKTVKTLTGYNLTAKDIALAILDPATGQISITKGMQTGKAMKFNDPNFQVTLKTFNGVNSRFTVSKPEGGTIVALKYLITGPESGSKAAIEGALREALYVPYSSNLNQPDVIAYGEQYLKGVIQKVAQDLQHIPSQSVPGKMIPEAINPSLIRALVYAEHTDTAAVLRGDIKSTVDQLNILLAANEGDTYRYSGSSAGALGIAQFISSTYLSLVQRHPEAGLISDFRAGMADHYNSIKAMYLLIDDYAGTVRAKAVGFAEGQVFDYGAAAYNGGTTRVIRAINAYGSGWNQDQGSQINALQAEVNSLSAQVKSLKSKVKGAKDSKTKTALQAELNSASSKLASATGQLDTLKAASLRNETVNYMQKIYKVIPYFNSLQI